MGVAMGTDAGAGAAAGVDAGSGLDAATGADAAGAGVVGSGSGEDAAVGALAGIATGMMGLAIGVGSEFEPPPQAARQAVNPATTPARQRYPGRSWPRLGAYAQGFDR